LINVIIILVAEIKKQQIKIDKEVADCKNQYSYGDKTALTPVVGQIANEMEQSVEAADTIEILDDNTEVCS